MSRQRNIITITDQAKNVTSFHERHLKYNCYLLLRAMPLVNIILQKKFLRCKT